MYRESLEGYGSDNSHQGFEVSSQDLLKRQFADTYDAMKAHYEQRIAQLSEVIQDTCMALCSDELLASMKLDTTSSAFMPAHISEILTTHVDAERERYLHELILNTSTLEAKNRTLLDRTEKQNIKITHLEADNHVGRKAITQIEVLTEKSRQLELQYKQIAEARSNEAEQYKSRIAALERERDSLETKNLLADRVLEERASDIERLRRQCESQATEVRQLENTVEQSTRDLAVIESVDAQEQQLKAELKEQLRQMAGERESLTAEIGDVRAQLRFAEAEVGRLEAVEQDKESALIDAREKQTQLMRQVEAMLQTESEESNAAIASVHEKMKELRHKLFTELTKEKRHSAAMYEELTALREFKDEKSRELRNALEDAATLRDKVQRESRNAEELSKQLAQQTAMAKEARMQRHEAEVLARHAQDTTVMLERKIADLELRHKEELLSAEEAARLRAGKVHDLNNMELRSQAYRLHYQNQMHESHAVLGINALRHSYSGSGTAQIDAQIGNPNRLDPTALEAALRSAKETWTRERLQLEQSVTQYIMKTEKLQSELDITQRKVQLDSAAHEEAILEAQKSRTRDLAVAAAQHDHEQGLIRSRLEEAGRNIEKLKNMVLEKKRQIDGMQVEMQRLQQAVADEVSYNRVRGRSDSFDEHKSKEHQLSELQSSLAAAEEAALNQRRAFEELHSDLAKEKQFVADLQTQVCVLQEQLQETKKQALQEQEADGAMLMDMKSKFDALMRQYESERSIVDPSMVPHGEDKDKEIARLRAQLAQAAHTIASNTPPRATNDEGSVSSASSANSSAAKAIAHRDAQLAHAKKEVSALEEQLLAYKQRMSELATQLEESRRALKSAHKAAKGGNISSSTESQQLIQLREEIQRRDVEIERMNHLHERKIVELQTAHEATLRAAGHAPGSALNSFSPPRVSKVSTAFLEGNNGHASAAKVKPALALSGRHPGYETAAKALLDALIRAQMIEAALALEVNRLVLDSDPSAVASLGQVVQTKVESALEKYKSEYQAALSLTINESEVLHSRIADLQTQLRRVQAEGGRGLNSSHYDEAVSVDADSSRGGNALAELEQSRHEHALLVELTKLEGDARTKKLLAQMKDLQKKHALEIDRIQAKQKEDLTVQKGIDETRIAALQEEMHTLKQTIAFQADTIADASQTRTSTLDTKLQLEKNRRKELIHQFEQIEEQHRVKIEELESANLVLEQRCERAELQVTRLKMEQLATNGVSHLTSTPLPATKSDR